MSDTIQRYTITTPVECRTPPFRDKDENGDYVLHADHLAAMAAKDAELKRNTDAYHDEVNRLADQTYRAQVRASEAEQEAAALRAALDDAITRMDRARDILSRPYGSNWAMLDTSTLKAARAGGGE